LRLDAPASPNLAGAFDLDRKLGRQVEQRGRERASERLPINLLRVEGEDICPVQAADIDRRHRPPVRRRPRPKDWMPQVSQNRMRDVVGVKLVFGQGVLNLLFSSKASSGAKARTEPSLPQREQLQLISLSNSTSTA
jgi:hypothetical protein